MALIPSARHSPEDLRHWHRLEAFDLRAGATDRHRVREAKAVEEIESFLRDGPAYISVSWGKDSVCVASLAAMNGIDVPIVWLRWPPVEDPDCQLVRDRFLSMFPHVDYREVIAPLRWYPDCEDWCYVNRVRGDFTPLHEAHGDRRITGVRSEESSARKMREAIHGVSTRLTCAPITRWKGTDVFAHLAHHGLPVHPAYACSYGGALDRIRLRVDVLDGQRSKAWGGEEWERWYYRDEMRALDERRRQDLETYADDLEYYRMKP